MSQLDPKELEKALEACANEPIHIPNHIQPHGFLVAFCQDSNLVTRASDNLSEIFGTPSGKLLGSPASSILPNSFIEQISQQARSGPANSSASVPIVVNERLFEAVAHLVNNELVIEFEPSTEQTKKSEQNILLDLEQFCAEILKCNNHPALFNILAVFIRKITGFDRVKIYQFDEDWNGQVIAEDKEDFMQSYLGLSFPASDIPKQARELYKRNLLRQIVDSDYDAVRVINSDTKQNAILDMSFSVLRSVSPVHLQYLKNMGIGASMSLSILKDNELWGLVVCHHSTAKFVSYKVRALCEIMSHMFSSRQLTISKESAHQEAQDLQLVIDSLASTNPDKQKIEMLKGVETSSFKLLRAEGLVIFYRGKKRTFGAVPSDKDLESIRIWYRQRQYRELYKTSDVGSVLTKGGFNIALEGGILVAPIGYHKDNFVCWFRAPQTSKIDWAGNPGNHAELDIKGRLSPRNSFEIWKSEVKHKSAPWEEKCLGIAEYIVSVIQEAEKRELEAKNLAKSDFLSHMSHELRTPLSAISSIAQILGEVQGFPADKQNLIDSLKVSSRSLMSLVNDLLDLNKIEAGAIELNIVEFSAEELMEEIRSVMGIEAAIKELAFNINYGNGKEIVLSGDITKLRQVLLNLVGNALKFTPSGFVNVDCNVKESSRQSDKAEVSIEVSDSGVGIAENKIERIFDKFTQADSSISAKYGGSGLGLNISKSLMEIMDGEISVTSKLGKGTTFSIKIDLLICKNDRNRQTDSLAQPIDTQQDEKINKRILLAEDYQGNIVAILHYLQSKGFTVSIANNGEEAVKEANLHNFDVILMDIQMPIMDGISATRLIRQVHGKNNKQDVPIIGMTASAMKEDKQRCLDAGMTDYISKPLKLNELLEKIKQYI